MDSILKLKKAPLVYFVCKDRPLRMDYRFGYKRTPESELKYRVGQWWRSSNSGKLVRHMRPLAYDTREEAEAVMSKYNKELMENCPWEHYEIAK